MNKLLTKIAASVLGLSMAIGVGVAAGTNQGQAAKTNAAETNTVESTSYSSSSFTGDLTWTASGGEDKSSYYLLKGENRAASIVSAGFSASDVDFSKSMTFTLNTRTFGGTSYNTSDIVAYSNSTLTSAVSGTCSVVAADKNLANKTGTMTFTGSASTLYFKIDSGTTSSANGPGIAKISFTYTVASSGVVRTITTTVTNGTYTGDQSISENGSASVTISPNTGYKLPSSVSVSGATYTYDSTTGVISLSNPTSNVTISAAMAAATQYSISTSLTHLTASGSTTIYENGTATITLAVDDSTKYALPKTISVTNSTGYEYNSTTGVVTLHGAQGNVTITASAIDKPAEESESFDFTDSGLWTGSEKNDKDKFTVYSRTVDLVTMTWDTNGQSSLAGAYWNPARIYVGHKITISSVTGQGGVTTIKSVTFHTVKNGNSYTTAGTNNANITVTAPTQGAGTIASAVNELDVTYTITGTVTEFSLVIVGSQSRYSSVEVVYDKDQSDVSLNSITASCDPILVSQTRKPTITFNPANATNKNVSYEIVENTGEYASVSADGTITGLGNGIARVKITPEDTNASAITISVTINSLPTIHGVEVGKQYAITSDGYELTGLNSGNYGESTSFSGTPSNAFPVRVVNGLYARTIALEVTINEETQYLSFDAVTNTNSLNYVSTINRESSWIFAEEDSKLAIRNVNAYTRMLTFYGDTTRRFACYNESTATGDKCSELEFVEIAAAGKTDKEYVQDFVDLYMHMTDYDQGGTIGSTNGSGWCKDGQHSYYLTAKAGYNQLIHNISEREDIWSDDSDFAAAKARYQEWARLNNDAAPYDGNDTVVTPIHNSRVILSDALSSNGSVVIITIVSLISISAFGAFLFLRKRKEQ